MMTADAAISTLAKHIQVQNRGANSDPKNQELVRVKDMEAWRLYTEEGKTYQQIADALGWKTKKSVYDAIRRFARDAIQLTAREMRTVAKERLDQLFAVYFDKGLKGDLGAAKFCKAVLDSESENYGYKQQPSQNEQDVERQAQERAQQAAWAEVQLAQLCRTFSESQGREVTPEEVLATLTKEHGESGAYLAQTISEALGADAGMTQSAAVN